MSASDLQVLSQSLGCTNSYESGRIAPETKTQNYTVRKGEGLEEIVMRLTGSHNWRPVYALNKDAIGTNPNYIAEGTVLIIPEAIDHDSDTFD